MSQDLKRARKLAQECRRTMFCDEGRSRLADALKTLDAELTQRESLCRELLEALLYYRDHCSGAEPSLSVFQRMMDAAIAKATGQGVSHG